MIKVFINPMANDGILRVIEAQYKYLPQFGVQTVKNIQEADVICNHGTALDEIVGIPSVHVGHGLYWSRQNWGDDFMQVNEMVVESMRHAVAHTAPSEWVGNAIRRGGYFYPEVVYHGIDANDFTPKNEHESYVLWNKARSDYVSDPNDVMKVSGYAPRRQFISTIGRASENLKIIGALPHAKMKGVVAGAGVYLATARETFGIGTLEAMAYGIPVAGWDWGGTKEIIINGETGFLAPPGDFQALSECIERCFQERERLSLNCIEDVKARWRWEPRIEQYANIFKRVHQKYNEKTSPKASVIVTAYHLDEYLPACLESVTNQTYPDFECLVIDDADLKSTKEIVSEYAKRDSRIRYIATPENLGLPGARNFGLSNSCGKYIRHVDADDFLAPNALELEVAALDTDQGTAIVYGHLETVRSDGSRFLEGNGDVIRSGWPEDQFKWHHQMAHLNQLPSCVMARREVYERGGGYRVRMKRNEDAEFWCRVTSLGFRATKFTQAVTYFHRERSDSKGAMEWEKQGSEPDWTAWFPWRWGSHDLKTAREVLYKRGDKPRNIHLVPFGSQGTPPAGQKFWYVHDHAYPVVSIIVTCGPHHRPFLIDALDSIQAQTYPDWECIVVNDTGEKWEKDIMGAPWAKVVNMDGNRGVSAARNKGYKHISSSSKFVIWMDADDFWFPWFLERMMLYAEVNPGVVFSDMFLLDDKNTYKLYAYPDFHSDRVTTTIQYPGSSVLVPRTIVEAMLEYQGGFSIDIPGLEDWDFQIGVHHLGFCAHHIPEPLFVYRIYTSTKREVDYAKIGAIEEYLDKKYSQYRKGTDKIMCGCQTKKPSVKVPSSLLSSSGNFSNTSDVVDAQNPNQMVSMEYFGSNKASFSVRSRVARNVSYRFGNNALHNIRDVFVGDIDHLLGINEQGKQVFRVLSNIAVLDTNDPAAFLGQPISAGT